VGEVLVVEGLPQEVICLVPLLLVQALELELAAWGISISFEITLSFNNSDRLCNKTHRCSSQSYNKLVRETHSWLL
jgi:hypothetical protein